MDREYIKRLRKAYQEMIKTVHKGQLIQTKLTRFCGHESLNGRPGHA